MLRLIVLFILTAFTTTLYGQQDCIDSLFAIKDSSKLKVYHRHKVDQGNEWCIVIDSINYSIIRRLKKDNTPIYESVRNTLTHIARCVSYHDNGCVFEVGYWYTNGLEYIGKWYYYSDSGIPDSIVDHDTKKGCSFCSLYALAEEKGFTQSDYTDDLERTWIEFDDAQRTWRFIQTIDAPDTVYNNTLEVQIDSMRVSVQHDARWIFPVPVTVTAFGLTGGVIEPGKAEQRKALENCPYVFAELYNFDISLKYYLISYSVKFLRNGKVFKDKTCKGMIIPKRIINYINKLSPGDEVIFYNVKIDEHRHGLYSKFSSVSEVRFKIQ